jgi:hypothetical protein
MARAEEATKRYSKVAEIVERHGDFINVISH